jgi:hypothetical protein
VFKGPALQQTGASAAIDPSQEMTEAEPEGWRFDTQDTQPVEAEDRFELEEQAEKDRFNVEPAPTETMAGPLDSVATAAPVAARVPRKATPKKPPARATKRSKKPAGSQSPGKNRV